MHAITLEDVDWCPPNQLAPWYLMAGWLYNSRDTSIMSDATWDLLVSRLAAEWDTVEHRHKYAIDPSAFDTATAMYLTDETVPLMARGAAALLAGRGIDAGRSHILPEGWPGDRTFAEVLTEIADDGF